MSNRGQKRNSDALGILSVEFQRRYESQFAYRSLVTMLAGLPLLRGFWTFGANTNFSPFPIAAAYTLSRSSATDPQLGFDVTKLFPLAYFGGTGYVYYNDSAQWDILGTETAALAANRGLTIAGWWNASNLPGTPLGLITKRLVAGNQRSYWLYINNDSPAFEMDQLGTGVTVAGITSSINISTGQWFFAAGRFVPSTSADVYVGTSDGLTKDSDLVAVPASIFNSTARFVIGASDGPAYYYNGYATCPFICAGALSDSIIDMLFQQSRAAFGV